MRAEEGRVHARVHARVCARVCARCGAVCESPKLCGRCRDASYCSKACQTDHWPAHRLVCARGVRVGECGECGAGVFATASFAPGAEIHREKPLLRTQFDRSDPTSARAKDALGRVSREARDAAMALSDVWTRPKTLRGVMMTNCLPVGPPNRQEEALFALVCRVNHSCRPNACYVWREDLQRELLIAIRPVDRGDEVTVCYIDETRDARTRQRLLMERFKFRCRCTLCEENDPATNTTMERLQEIDESIPAVARSDPRRAVRMATDALALLDEVGLGQAYWRKRYLCDLFQIHASNNEERKAHLYYGLALAAAVECEGGNSPAGVRLLTDVG